MTRQPCMKAYVDAHRGERFLVCGMGTSIDQFPRSFYERCPGVTIGVNEITDLFEPDYRIPNAAVEPWLERCILKKGQERPISFEYASPSATVETEKNGVLSKRGTCAVPAFTAAYQMGASEIYLVGVDFLPGPAGRIYFRECSKQAPAYYQLTDEADTELQAVLKCFADAFVKYRQAGVAVYNLSLNSRLKGVATVSLDAEYNLR